MRRRDPKADAASQADTAWDEVDMAPLAEGLIGLTFSVTRHTCKRSRISSPTITGLNSSLDRCWNVGRLF